MHTQGLDYNLFFHRQHSYSENPLAKILLADDDPMILRLLEVKLGQAGHDIITAEDGLQALDAVLGGLPDLVVLDGIMPGLDGLEVLQRLQADERTKGIPVIMLTARTQEKDVADGLSSGAADYVAKPVRPDELIACIERLIGA
jgi:DNA-binding response OmpR family regulator